MRDDWNKFDFGRDWCSDFAISGSRQWLVTNGIGGYASGTIAGQQSSRYQGLLIAALEPPVGRTLLVSRFEETVHYRGNSYDLYTNQSAPDEVSPRGFLVLERFRLEGTIPVWTYACADAQLEKRIWMGQGENTTYLQYKFIRGLEPLELSIKIFVNYRDHHAETHSGDAQIEVQLASNRLELLPIKGGKPYSLSTTLGKIELKQEWVPNYFMSIEAERGLPDTECHLLAGIGRVILQPGSEVAFIATTKPSPNMDPVMAYQAKVNQDQNRLLHAVGDLAPAWLHQLVLAADQFIVSRPLPEEPEGLSVIAGYPWFGDWGRDTMISLPGLTLAVGRVEVARKILQTFARYVDRGMLPNNFPDTDQAPEYNTVDASLWYFEAIRAYYQKTQDNILLRDLFPILDDIVSWHLRGTRYSIHVDESDGLLYAGEPGVQLTWMDAKVEDWVVTPRTGKPVEINALWYHALCCMELFAQEISFPCEKYRQLAEQAKSGFQRFWIADAGYCFDVIDGPLGNDPALRPNQLFAVSLPFSPLSSFQQHSIVDICARHLLTSHGLRSLSKENLDRQHNPDYIGIYTGDRRARDAAYHQGTVWGWLLGPFVSAYLRVYQDREQARSFLIPLIQQLSSHCIGSLSEIFDGDPPFNPRGCIAQAWTVAEVLRAWFETEPAEN